MALAKAGNYSVSAFFVLTGFLLARTAPWASIVKQGVGAWALKRLLRLAPNLVTLAPFLFPVYGTPLHRAFYGAGLTLYDLLGAARDGGRSRHLGAKAVARLAPPIRMEGLAGGVRCHTSGRCRRCAPALRY